MRHKNITRFSFTTLLLLFTVLFALFLRTVWLDRIPTGISDDELGFILNAKSVFLTGKNITGDWSPLSLTPPSQGFPQAEIPYLLIAPIIGMLPFSLLNAKLPYVFVSVLQVLLLYALTKKLIGKREALVVGIVAACNPWSILFGRTAYEAPLAIFFYLLAFYILISTRGWKLLLAFLPLFLAFYSYMGTKLIFLPYVLIIALYSWFVTHRKQYTKQHVVLICLSTLLFFFFVFSAKNQSTAARFSELLSPNSASIIKTVDEERRLSIKNPTTYLFSNKLVAFEKELINKYLRVFSTNLLFLNGEGRSTFSLWYHGYFYYVDSLFLMLGACVLFAHKKKIFILLSLLIFIAPIPTIASTIETGFSALRASLLYPLFIIVIGVGISHIFSLAFSKKHMLLISFLLVFIYSLHVLNFINIYFFRNPIYNSEAYNLSSRIISKYITLADQHGKDVFVISDNPRIAFEHYLFETNAYTRQTAIQIRDLVRQNSFILNNVHFIYCEDPLLTSNTLSQFTLIVSPVIRCEKAKVSSHQDNVTIGQLSDSGAIFHIVNDHVCGNYGLCRYPDNFLMSDLAVETLPEERFCKKFITDTNLPKNSETLQDGSKNTNTTKPRCEEN